MLSRPFRALPFLFLFAGALCPLKAEVPASQRVFVCAHSFMICTAKLLPTLAQSAGLPFVSAGQQMLGGSQVLQHWNLPDEKNKAKAALREGAVDVLTLSPIFLMPDPGIDNFTKLGLEKNPKLRVLVQASWPARDGVLIGEFKNEKRNEATLESLHFLRDTLRELWLSKLETQVRSLNESAGHEAVFIVPVGDAVFTLREEILNGTAPGLSKQTDLFRDDIGHPKAPLAQLIAYCHFAAIYQRSPVGLPVPEELRSNPKAEELNRRLQEIAWDTVSKYPLSGVKAAAAPAAKQG